MNTKPFLAALLLLAAAVTVLPTVSAAAPTKDCEVDFVPDATHPSLTINAQADGKYMADTAGGILALSYVADKASGRDQYTVGLNNQCGQIWSQPCTTTGASACNKFPVIADPAGQFAMNARLTDNTGADASVTYQHFSRNSGALLSGLSAVSTIGQWGTCSGTSIVAYTGSAYYSTTANQIRSILTTFCGANPSKTVIVSDTAVVAAYTMGYPSVTAPKTFGETSTEAYALSFSGGSSSAFKFNLADGTNIGSAYTIPFSSCSGAGPDLLLARAHANSFYVFTCDGTNSQGYSRIATGTMTAAESNVKFGAGGNNNVANTVMFNRRDIDLDDNILACGYDLTTFSTNIVKLNTDAGHAVDWSVSTDPVNGHGTCYGAKLDHAGGFFIWGLYNVPVSGQTAVFVQHWTGGGFNMPPTPTIVNHADLYPNPDGSGGGGLTSNTGPVAGVVDVGSGIKSFAQSMGFVSSGSLFFFGLLLSALVGLIIAAATAALGGKAYAGLMGAVVTTGMALFCILAGLWEVWAGVVFIILCAAIVSLAVRRLFAGGGASAGGGGGGGDV